MQRMILTIGALMLALLPLETQVHAQQAEQRPLTAAESQLHLALSQMCANEAFHSYGDCLLIFQATRRHGSTPEARLAWLRSHSRCVLVAVPPREMRGNCRWTRTLTLADGQPPGWVPSRDGVWEGLNSRQWVRVRDTIGRLLRGARPRGGWPCQMDPDTWAGRRTDEQRIAALPPTMVALRCTNPLNREQETANEGFRVMTEEQRAAFLERQEPREEQFVDINPGQDVDHD